MNLEPLNGCVLVEIEASPYKHAAVTESKFDSRTNGVVIAVPDNRAIHEGEPTQPAEPLSYLIGKRVYWNDYQDGTWIKNGDKNYSFIKYEDIRGWQK